ncbi:beta-ketoacyl-ACP reductase [Scandinavium goeteborgense]|uniref:beta-ketoacyl-ACP reductase n=1 Tax=Scandinavium goeteborgense TaxID=1851514 RepID=UPI000F66435E|nr:beta-ketoacyl-ACP reductase [Scandinavium goeteborgense]QKN79836.1 beta-ketoacyl-ACP reductase [Scandinavium goeteborgense]
MKKIAIVTGGTRGIGAAISRKLLEDNYHVVAVATNPARSKQWVDELHHDGLTNIETVACDITDLDMCCSLVESVQQKHGQIDVLINNAGITRDTTFRKMSKLEWSSVIDTNLNGLFNMTRAVMDTMLDRHHGRVINVSSINGQKGQFGQVNYSASKAGVHGFTKALAQEVAKKNITVNTVSPGYIDTEMMRAVPENIRENIQKDIPAGRFGKPEEVASLIAYLVSDNAAFITGADFSINGGQHMY